jgi:hypothetical protein
MTYYERLIQELSTIRQDDYDENAYKKMFSTYLKKYNLYGTKNKVVEIVEDYYTDFWKSRYFEDMNVVAIDIDNLTEASNVSVKCKIENNLTVDSDLIIKWVSKSATGHLLATTWINLDYFIKENNISIDKLDYGCDNSCSYIFDYNALTKIFNTTIDEITYGNPKLLRSEVVQYLKCIDQDINYLASVDFSHRAQKMQVNTGNKSWHSIVGKNLLAESDAFATLINLIDAKTIFKFTKDDSNVIDQEINTNVNLNFHEIPNEYFENSSFFNNIIMKMWFIIVISKRTNKICNIYVCTYNDKESIENGFYFWTDTKNKIKQYKKGIIKSISFMQSSEDKTFHVRPHSTKGAKNYPDTDISIKSWWINKSGIAKNNLLNITFEKNYC